MNISDISAIKNTLLIFKPSTAIRLLLMVLLVSINPIFSFGQCSFTGATTSVGTYSFCIDYNSNTITTANVSAGQYAILNVVKGFDYTFSYPNVFGTQTITLYNATNTSIVLTSGNSTNALCQAWWTATFSGQVYVLISREGCNNVANASNGPITITLDSIGNTQDSQTTFGTDTWIGHIYNNPEGGASPEPFIDDNYAGYYSVSQETINESFGGNTVCFPVFSSGTQRASINTAQFAVRYRMNSTRAAGYYFMNANADDGIRVIVDGVTALNNWSDHLNTVYCNNLIYLDGSSDIILDYYENGEDNVIGFNLVPITGNTISSYADINVCSGTTVNLDGSSILNCTGTSNTTYQWQSSTDNVNFTNIAGATAEDYSPPAVTPATVDVKYYRRVLKAFGVEITASNPATGSVKVTFLTNTLTPTGAAVQSFCPGATIANLAATGTAIKWYVASSGGSSLPSATVLVNGTHYYATQTLDSCESSTRFDVTAAVTPTPSAPTIGSTTQPTCSTATGSVVLSGLPASGTINQTGAVVASYSITGTSMTISGLVAGTYNFTVTNASGCTSSPSANVNIIAFVPVDNIWNGSVWSTGSPPPTINGTQNIVFNSSFTTSTDLSGCSCQANANVSIQNGHTLTLTDKLTVNEGVTMIFEDTASLVQINNVANSGVIKYNRLTQSRNSDYTYWSSPVSSSQPLGGALGLFPNSLNGTFYSFDSSINPAEWKNESAATAMTVGKGYIARGPEDSGNQTPPETPFTTTFNGVPNNGTINVPIIHSGASDGTSNLIGNPYPSAVDANTFLSTNSTVIEGTIYFWTHNTMIGAGTTELGSGLYAYTGNDYASYNGTGGAAGSGGKIPNGKIAAGQGFFVTSKLASGTAKFENTMRIAGNNSQFFKKRNSKTEKTIEKNRIWLNLTNTQGAFKQTLVGYITGATNDYDDRFDGESFDGNEFVDFYSINQDKNLVIQGRALPFDENDEIPLGYRTTINGDFTINIDQVDGSLANQAVFLEDKLTQKVFDLKSGNYKFNTVSGTFNDRFVLRYTNKTLGKEEVELNDGIIALYLNNYKTLIIRNNVNDATVNAVELFNLLGQNITNWKVDDSEQINIQIPIKNTSSGIYIIKIKTTKGEFSKKIIIK